MKRILMVLATVAGVGLSAGHALADHGGYTAPGGAGAGSIPTISQIGGPNTLLGAGDLPPGRGPDMYGLHPCLKRFFHMDLEQATRVMLHVHQKGVGVCGIFPYEIAETKVNQVMDFARQNQHPLQCTLEKA